MPGLNATDARIFRITHVKNVAWMLDHGLVCRSNPKADPKFITIGMESLIEKRKTRRVPIPPGGTLSDYVPFYFTPASVMLYNIKTGHNGVKQRSNTEIAILVSSLPKRKEAGVRFVFTNGHAYMEETDYFSELRDLDKIDWAFFNAGIFPAIRMIRVKWAGIRPRHWPIAGCRWMHCRALRVTMLRLSASSSNTSIADN